MVGAGGGGRAVPVAVGAQTVMVGPETGWPAGPKTMSSLREPCARAAGAAMVARVRMASAVAAVARIAAAMARARTGAQRIAAKTREVALEPRSIGLRRSNGAQAGVP